MRQFKLYRLNGAGGSDNTVDLTPGSGSNVTLTDPSGLGIQLGGEFADLRHGFFKTINDDIIPQGNIVGTLVFHPSASGSAYDAYRAFADWIMKAQELRFGYKPSSASAYYLCTVKLDYLTKTEINAGLCLECPVSFKMLEPWSTTSQVTLTRIGTSREYSATINLEGQIPAAFDLTIRGSRSPNVIRAAIGGNDVGNIHFSSDTPNLGTFEYKTLYNGSTVETFANTGESQTLESYITDVFAGEPFFRIPVNLGSSVDFRVVFPSGAALPTSLSLNMSYYFRSV